MQKQKESNFDILQVRQQIPQFNSPIICAYGPTGSGKSSLINYLLKNSLKFTKTRGKYLISQSDQSQSGPVIGNDMNSMTRAISAHRWNEQLLVDLMGSDDTRGMNVEIKNALMIQEMMKKGLKLKLMLIISIHQLNSGKGVKFFETLNRLSKLLINDLSRMHDSMILIISKIKEEQYTKQEVSEIIEDCLQSNKHLITAQVYELFLKILPKKTCIFLCPDEQHFHHELEIIVKNAKKMKYHELSRSVNVSLSSSARSCLQKQISWAYDNIQGSLDFFGKEVQLNIFRNTFGSINENDKVIKILKKFKKSAEEKRLQTFRLINKEFSVIKKNDFFHQLSRNFEQVQLFSKLLNTKPAFNFHIFENYLQNCLNILEKRNQSIRNEIEKNERRVFLQRKEREERQRRQRIIAEQRKRQQQEVKKQRQRMRIEREQAKKRMQEQNRRRQAEKVEMQRKIQEQKRRAEEERRKAEEANRKRLSEGQKIEREVKRIGKQAENVVKKLFKW